MNHDDPLHPQTHPAAISYGAIRAWGIFTFLTIMGASASILILLFEPIESRLSLFITYAIAVLSTTGALHGALLAVPKARRQPISRRTPKYLEYGYTLLIAVGLFQIIASPPHLLEYVNLVAGDTQTLLSEIRTTAQHNLENECRKDDKVFYTPEFCQKLVLIVQADDLLSFTLDTLANDATFMEHTGVQRRKGFLASPTPEPPVTRGKGFSAGKPRPTHSSIVKKIRYLQTHAYFGSDLDTRESRGALTWIAIVLLPLAIALRLTKTSLELWGTFRD